MKTSLRKLVATVSGLAIAAVLPMASMMASAEDASLDFVAEKNEAGDQIILSVNVAGMDGVYSETDEYTNAWNVLEYNIAYDEDQVTPVQQPDEFGVPADYLPGNANRNATIEVNLAKDGVPTNPVLVGAISSNGQFLNGTVMTIAFKLAEGVAAEDVELTVNVSQFAKSVIVDGQAKDPTDLVAPGSYTVTVKGGTEPTESQPTESQPTESQPTESQPTESKPTESQPTKDTDTSDTEDTDTTDTGDTNTSDTKDTAASGTDTTASGSDTDVPVITDPSGDDVQPTLPSTDITVDGGNGGSGDVATGESTALFVVALVLMAGSAAALVVMKKKKVFSK